MTSAEIAIVAAVVTVTGPPQLNVWGPPPPAATESRISGSAWNVGLKAARAQDIRPSTESRAAFWREATKRSNYMDRKMGLGQNTQVL